VGGGVVVLAAGPVVVERPRVVVEAAGAVVVLPAGAVVVLPAGAVVVLAPRAVVVAAGTVVLAAGPVVVGAPDGGVPFRDRANQLLRSLSASANWLPVTTTVPLEPLTSTRVARPPIWPRPLRWTTVTDATVPAPGNRAWTVASGTETDQVWLGFAATESPRSATAGNAPPAL
jgi:hypothetical protein